MYPGSLLDWIYNEVQIGAPMRTACEFPDFHALALFSFHTDYIVTAGMIWIAITFHKLDSMGSLDLSLTNGDPCYPHYSLSNPSFCKNVSKWPLIRGEGLATLSAGLKQQAFAARKSSPPRTISVNAPPSVSRR